MRQAFHGHHPDDESFRMASDHHTVRGPGRPQGRDTVVKNRDAISASAALKMYTLFQSIEVSELLNKKTAVQPFFYYLFRSFRQIANAFGAQCLFHRDTVFNHGDTLKIRMECPVRRSL